jgi:hypothetical protein
MKNINEFIEFSNFMLINFWWLILPVCSVLGILLFFVSKSFDNEPVNKTFVDSGIKWDKYGNPIIGEDEQ